MSIVFLADNLAEADPQVNHIVDINEVYSNADGTRQFVELMSGSIGQNQLAPIWIIALNADGTDTNVVFDFTSTFAPGFNTNETILLMTSAMQADLGLTADFTIPPNSIFLTNGRVIFEDPPPFGQVVDAVAYGAYTGDNGVFGSPTAALPADGCRSLRRNTHGYLGASNNALQWGVAASATPRNHDGDSVIVTCPPAPPILAAIGNKSTNEGQLLTFGISATDGNDDVIILTAENRPSGASFVNHGNGTGTFTWTPGYLQAAVYMNVLFIASDGGLADSESISITVNEVTDPAVARDSTANTNEDNSVNANLQGYDPDDDPVTYAIISGPSNGQAQGLVASTGAFTYQPNENFNGDDNLLFTISDGIAPPDTGLWSIAVAAVNDPPVAQDVAMAVPKNTLTNSGAMPVTDVDNASWTISHNSGPFNGSITNFNSATGSFDYTPDPDYVGPDSIKYVANDGAGPGKSASQSPSNTGTVRISVVEGCVCPCKFDPDCNGTIVDVLDVVETVGRAFRGNVGITDPACLKERTDLNASGATDVLDVVACVNVAFRGQEISINFVDPCL